MSDESTIAAVATPSGHGGIGIIKVSGPKALPAAGALFCRGAPDPDRPSSPVTPDALESWRLYHGHIYDRVTDRVYDEVVLAVMRAPHSYTCEDVIEIQAHAGPVLLRAILNLLIDRGIRLAEPGEFTRRAFLNGRIDLTQAEAVMDVIHAQSEAGLDIAIQQLGGAMVSVIGQIRSVLLNSLSEIEALIDFPDTVFEDAFDQQNLIDRLHHSAWQPVVDLIERHEARNFLREGLRVAIVGGPNVGKSSLLNRLLDADRAIVTDVPGTTRDLIEASFFARGTPVVLADTAGLRSDPEPVEQIGIDKARQYAEKADLVLFVVDVGRSAQGSDLAFFEELGAQPKILVMNKSDLPAAQQRFEVPENWQAVTRLAVSALYGTGLEPLKDSIGNMADEMAGQSEDRLVPNLRHKARLKRSEENIISALQRLSENSGMELAAIDLREAYEALGEITGEHIAPDVLDQIFQHYCVGK